MESTDPPVGTDAEPTSPAPPAEPAEIRVAGFWRRFAAWLLDVVMLGVFGQIVALPFHGPLMALGPAGRLIGIPILLLYFGLLSSHLGDGRTLGKRALGISVRNAAGLPIGISRALARAALLVMPYLLNGMALSRNLAVLGLQGVVVFGLGGAILCTMIFNRQARQGFHDILCGTWVVRDAPAPTAFSAPLTPPLHRNVAYGFIGLAACVGLAGMAWKPHGLAPAWSIYEVLANDGRFWTVSVNDGRMYAKGQSHRVMNVTVWAKKRQTDDSARDGLATDVARTVLDHPAAIEGTESLVVSIVEAFDVGIASGHRTYKRWGPPAEWRARTSAGAPPSTP